MKFFVGVFKLNDVHRFDRAFVSVNQLRRRKSPFPANEWIMDSGAFSELEKHGGYRHPPSAYAAEARRWAGVGNLALIVAQDFMCEPFMLDRTGLTVAEHQRLTIERYDALMDEDLPAPVMPVLQGYEPAEYARHLDAYGARLKPGMWVGVGSVCKRNGAPAEVANVLSEVHRLRPDLRLHGFGVKKTALRHDAVHAILYSADSMAWSLHARRNGRDVNDWREAKRYEESVARIINREARAWQRTLALA